MKVKIEQAIVEQKRCAPSEFKYGLYYSDTGRSTVVTKITDSHVISFCATGMLTYHVSGLGDLKRYHEIAVSEITLKIKELS